MDINDYLIDQEGIDWAALLGQWPWLIPATLTVWLVNRFGDIFAVVEDGSIHMFDIGVGTFEQVADSQDHFCDLLDTEDHASDWLMLSLVDELVAAGKTLNPGECYGFLQPPVLGGDYAVENIEVMPIEEHFGINAQIHEQIKDLPDGAEVTIEFEGK